MVVALLPQAQVTSYKDAVKAVSTHASLTAKKLAPQMAQLVTKVSSAVACLGQLGPLSAGPGFACCWPFQTHTVMGACNVLLAPVSVCQYCCDQDRHQLEALAAKLSAELAKQQQHAATSAHHSGSSLLDVQVLQVELEEFLQGHADHLRAAASFPTPLVTQALEVSLPHHCAHLFVVPTATADHTDELPNVAALQCFPRPSCRHTLNPQTPYAAGCKGCQGS